MMWLEAQGVGLVVRPCKRLCKGGSTVDNVTQLLHKGCTTCLLMPVGYAVPFFHEHAEV
jgi:hypothetical protein